MADLSSSVSEAGKRESLFSLLPVEIHCQIFSLLDPLDSLLFASSSIEHLKIARSTIGLELKPVVVFTLPTLSLLLHKDVPTPGEIEEEECFACHTELNKKEEDGEEPTSNDQKKSAVLQSIVSLLSSSIVKKIRIVMSSDAIVCSNLLHFLRILRSKNKKCYDWVAVGMMDKFNWCQNNSLNSTFTTLTEVLPMRRLFVEMSCACERGDCVAIGNLVYDDTHTSVRSLLDYVRGPLRYECNFFASRFPRLRGFHNTCLVPARQSPDHLTVLDNVRAFIEEWKSGGGWFSFETSVEMDLTALSGNHDFSKFHALVTEFEKKGLQYSADSVSMSFSRGKSDGGRLFCFISSATTNKNTTITCRTEERKKSNETKEDEEK